MSFGNIANTDYVDNLSDTSGLGGSRPPSGIDGRDAVDRLQGIIDRAQSWPIWAADRVGGVDTGTYPQAGMYGGSLRDLALWVAFRENDREALIDLTSWASDRELHIDPLPERISVAYSDLLYGEEPEFVAGDKSDQDNMDEMAEETALASELKRWCDCCVSEGEYWWRSWTDLDVSEWPLISGHSRLNVLPLYVGRKIAAAAFIDNVFTDEITVEGQVHVRYWRHIEIHSVGYVRNLLYVGGIGQLGERRELSDLLETQDLEEDWDHGLPIMLAGRIPNKLGRDFRLGISEYHGVRDLLMDLNEARTIMAENARLVLKARMLVPQDALDSSGNFDASKDIIPVETSDEELGGKNTGPYTVLEYTFRAAELISHKHELTLDILARCGLAEQFVQESRGGSGQAFTGTALRTRLIPTIQSASGKARNWDKEVPKMLAALAQLSALPPERGGCGQSWTNAEGPHIQRRSSVLPEDQNEEIQRHVMAVQGEVESIQTAVTATHDDWEEDQVELEVARIRADRSAGPTYASDGTDPKDLEPVDIPNEVPGGPNSAVPSPSDLVGSSQPGAGRPVDGQSPGKQPPRVTAGGPK